MVGSPRSQGTRENNFRGRETSRRKQNPGESGAAQQKPCWGLGEEAFQASPAFQMLISKSLAPSKKGDLGARAAKGSELQRV